MDQKSKLISYILIVVMVVISMHPVASYAKQEIEINNNMIFTDMPDDWSTIALQNAVKNGLLFGKDGMIMPNENFTRAQLADVLVRAFGTTQKASLSNYDDVDENASYYADMEKAVQMGAFEGSGNKLNPDDNITREEVFIVLTRVFELSKICENALDKFSDKDLVSPWAEKATASIVSAGYIEGLNDKLEPTKYITRAEFAQIMDNILKNYIREAGTYTEDLYGNVMVNVPDVILKDMTIEGDLIIGDGVGDGNITLDGVKITGRTIIRGGGVNSIKIIGDSDITNIIITRVDGEVRVYTQDGVQIGDIIVDGKDDVIIEGDIGDVTILASDVTVTATQATITTAIIQGDNSKIIVAMNSNVDRATIKGEDSEVVVLEGGKIENVTVDGNGTKIRGEGEVNYVEANADNISVSTMGTKVKAAKGTTGIKAGEKIVSEGNTEIVGGESNSSNNNYNRPSVTSPLSSFTPITFTQTGDIEHNNVQYITASAIISALPKGVPVTLENSSVVNVPISWTDTDSYDAGTAGVYTFTASWGTMPKGANNNNNLEAPTVEITVLSGKEAEKKIIGYSFVGVERNGIIDESNKEIAIVVPYGTDLASLVATFTTTENTIVKVGENSQTSGTTPNDFTNPVEYIVTADDGSIATYTVTVFVESHKDCFVFDSEAGMITGYNEEKIEHEVVIPTMIDGVAVTSIGDESFLQCAQLHRIIFQDNVTSIGTIALAACENLTEILVLSNNEFYSSFNGVLYNKDHTTLLQYPCFKAGSYIIPDGVISIEYASFAFCSALTNVIIPDSVEIIEESAFYYCSALSNVIIPDSV